MTQKAVIQTYSLENWLINFLVALKSRAIPFRKKSMLLHFKLYDHLHDVTLSYQTTEVSTVNNLVSDKSELLCKSN